MAPVFQNPEIQRRMHIPATQIHGNPRWARAAGIQMADIAGQKNAGGPGRPGMAGGEEDRIGFIILGAAPIGGSGQNRRGEQQYRNDPHRRQN
jgi:hypothetical protein